MTSASDRVATASSGGVRAARRAARVLVIDEDARLLLLSAREPAEGRVFWLAPGGGAEDGESFARTAVRGLHEETGLTAALGPWVWERRHVHAWGGRRPMPRDRASGAAGDGTRRRVRPPAG